MSISETNYVLIQTIVRLSNVKTPEERVILEEELTDFTRPQLEKLKAKLLEEIKKGFENSW